MKTNAKLTLTAGIYRFDALDVLEPNAQLIANTTNGSITVYVNGSFTSRGKITDTVGNGSRLLFVVLGQNWIALETPFRGSLIAPYGSLRLGSTWQDSHRGFYFAKEVDAVADSKVTLVPFVDWPNLGMCTPLTTTERSKATSLGLSPDAVYPVVGTERHVSLTVATNSRVNLGLRYESGRAPVNTAGRFRVLSMQGSRPLGGGTFVIRH